MSVPWVGGVAVGEFGGGPVSVDAGHRGVRPVQRPHLVDLGELLDLGVEKFGQRGRIGGLVLQPVPGVGVGGGVGFGGAEGRGLSVAGGGLGGASELVDHPWWCPGLFAFPGPDADPELPVAHTHLVGISVGSSQRAPGRAVGGVGLELSGLGWRADRVGGVVVVGEFAVRGDDPGPLLPRPPRIGVIGQRPERIGGPHRLLIDGLGAKLASTVVRSGGENGKQTLVIRVVDCGRPVCEGATDWIQRQRPVGGDPLVDDVGDLPRVIQ